MNDMQNNVLLAGSAGLPVGRVELHANHVIMYPIEERRYFGEDFRGKTTSNNNDKTILNVQNNFHIILNRRKRSNNKRKQLEILY